MKGDFHCFSEESQEEKKWIMKEMNNNFVSLFGGRDQSDHRLKLDHRA